MLGLASFELGLRSLSLSFSFALTSGNVVESHDSPNSTSNTAYPADIVCEDFIKRLPVMHINSLASEGKEKNNGSGVHQLLY